MPLSCKDSLTAVRTFLVGMTRAVRPVDAGLRMLLVLSLWHAPIPWIHTHAVAGPIVDHVDSLSRHVHEFHEEDAAQGETALGWHAHLVLPWCFDGSDSCPSDERPEPGHLAFAMKFGLTTSPQQTFASAIQLTAGPFVALAAPAGMPALSPPALAHCADYQHHRGRHFFETYGCSVSIGDLDSVRTC